MTTPSRLVNTTATGHPKVVAWRDYWLARSETFIRDQVTDLTRWEPVCVGRRTYANPLVVPHFAPHSDALGARLASRLPPSAGLRTNYDALLGDPAVRLVHAHFGMDGVTALPFAARAGKPLIVSFYGMDVTSMPFRRGRSAARYRSHLPELFERAHTLIAPSEFLCERLVALGASPAKITVNPPGTSVPPPAPEHLDRAGIIFVGRLVEKKGVADLLEAVALLPSALRSVPVTIVGYGPLAGSLQRRARQLKLNVTFAGQQSTAQIQQLLRSHAVFCGPSQWARNGDAESLGMVFIEAALAGMPVVAYGHGGVPESVAHLQTGLLAPERDVPMLASYLASLLTVPNRARAMGEAGYHRAARLFELRTRTARLEELYDSVAALDREPAT